ANALQEITEQGVIAHGTPRSRPPTPAALSLESALRQGVFRRLRFRLVQRRPGSFPGHGKSYIVTRTKHRFAPGSERVLPMSVANPAALPAGAKVKLSVVKGLRVGKNYALKDGVTYLGHKGPMAVDVDLTEQESPGVAVAINRFALIWLDKNGLGIADTG